MNKRLQKFFSDFVKTGKTIILAFPAPKFNLWAGVLLFFIALGILFPFSPAYAIWGIVGGIADGIAKAIAGVIISFMLAIPTAILGIASLILGWSIDPLFIRVGYTSGGVIDVGWPVTRDLANMGIVLALVFIGLGTALRLKEYQAQKTLPVLIGVALLINFTPVILGVIVDASNIVMNFFLEGLTGGQIIATVFSNISTMIVNDISFFNPAESIGTLASVVMIGIFMFFAAILFFLFALLFIIRRVAIWILVILAPIAFVAYILPGTRGFARMWWNQFIQWTIIGVFAAFFLWLGNHMIGLAAQGGLTGSVAPGGGGIIGNTIAAYLNSVLPYGVALIFLLIGFFAALSTSAMGASGIIAGAQRGTRAAGKRAAAIGWEGTKRRTRAVRAETARMQRTYQAGRALGLPRHRAAGEAARRYWRRRARPAMRPAAVGRRVVATARGTWSAIRDIGDTFRRAAFRIPRKGQIICGACGGAAPSGSIFCPHCGATI